MSSKVQLCLANLGLLDRGAAQLVIDDAIKKAVADAEDRGDDGKPRVVTIKLSVAKLKNGMMEATVEANLTLPVFRINPTAAQPRVDHGKKQLVLDFQPLSPSDPEKDTIPFGEESEAN